VNAKNGSGRCSGFVVVTVTEALSLDSFLDDESVTRSARRSYDDMLKEERVTVLSPDG
jgi:hypothetical protein